MSYNNYHRPYCSSASYTHKVPSSLPLLGRQLLEQAATASIGNHLASRLGRRATIHLMNLDISDDRVEIPALKEADLPKVSKMRSSASAWCRMVRRGTPLKNHER